MKNGQNKSWKPVIENIYFPCHTLKFRKLSLWKGKSTVRTVCTTNFRSVRKYFDEYFDGLVSILIQPIDFWKHWGNTKESCWSKNDADVIIEKNSEGKKIIKNPAGRRWSSQKKTDSYGFSKILQQKPRLLTIKLILDPRLCSIELCAYSFSLVVGVCFKGTN